MIAAVMNEKFQVVAVALSVIAGIFELVLGMSMNTTQPEPTGTQERHRQLVHVLIGLTMFIVAAIVGSAQSQ